jgi:hypothetical protein
MPAKEIALTDHRKVDVANSQFQKTQRVVQAKKAMTEYQSEAVAVDAKTERLKALRLEKEASDAAAPAAADPGAAAKPKRAAKSKEKGPNLSAWLREQSILGRNN